MKTSHNFLAILAGLVLTASLFIQDNGQINPMNQASLISVLDGATLSSRSRYGNQNQ